MKHLAFFISFLLLVPKISFSQQQQKAQYTNYIFDPKSDASEDLKFAKKRAAAEGKNVLLLVGGDWDYFSRKFNEAFTKDTAIQPFLNKHFVYERINFSPVNKNKEILDSLKCPRDQGYPVIIFLDKQGNTLHFETPEAYRHADFDRHALLNLIQKWANNSN